MAANLAVSPAGSQRRIQALVANGWPAAVLARMLGMLPTHLHRMLRADEPVRPGRAAEIAALYEQLWDAPPDESARGRRSAAEARKLAGRHGWAPPMAWDDDDSEGHGIDDPAATPAPGWKRGTLRDTEGVAEDAAFIMRTQDCGVREAAARLGMSRKSLGKVLSRAAEYQGRVAS